MAKKPLFHPQLNQTQVNDEKIRKHQQQRMQHSKPAAPSTQQVMQPYSNKHQQQQNQSQMQFQTPSYQYYKEDEQVQQKKKKKKKYLKVTCRILEAKLFVNLSKVFSMNVHCQFQYKDHIERTNSQSGMNPKWNEAFSIHIKDEKQDNMIELSVIHKGLWGIGSDEKIGNTIIYLTNLSSFNNCTDWYQLKSDKGEIVGTLLLCFSSEEIRLSKSKEKLIEDENIPDEDIDSVQNREQEISRQFSKKSRNNQFYGQEEKGYGGLKTQQQVANSGSYLNTQVNQPRQSLTEQSMIQLNSTHSSQEESQDYEETSRRHYQYVYEDDLGHIVPQQLFYGKNQHSSSYNNLLAVNNPQQLQKNQLHSNSQYLALEDINDNLANAGYIPVNQSHQVIQPSKAKKQHHHHHHHKKRKKKKDRQYYEQNRIIDNNDDINQEEETDNQENYVNQRPQQLFYQQNQIPYGNNNPNLYQMHSGSNKNQNIPPIDSRGASGSGSNGAHLYSGGNQIVNHGSSGSYLLKPSYYDEQNSVESMNGNQNVLMQNMMTQGYQLPTNFQDITDYNEIEQIKMCLDEENERLKNQEELVKPYFEKIKLQSSLINQEKEKLKRAKEQLKQESKRLQQQKVEQDYQKQQLERSYIHLKKEKQQRHQEYKMLQELFKQFNGLIANAKLLQNNKQNKEQVDIFLSTLKGIHQMIQQLLANSINEVKVLSKIEENSALLAMQNKAIHQQQDSASSLGTNSLGNYNFILQGNNMFQQPNKGTAYSPISQNYSQPNVNVSQQFKESGQKQYQNQGNDNKQNYMKDRFISPDSISPPKVITDIINEDDDMLEEAQYQNQEFFQNQAMQQNSQQQNQNFLIDDNFSPDQNEYDEELKLNTQQKKQKKNQFFPQEQNELSTIIERELTSQRRSSNGGLGPNTTIEGSNNRQNTNMMATQQTKDLQNEYDTEQFRSQSTNKQTEKEKKELQRLKESLMMKQQMFEQGLEFYQMQKQELDQEKQQQESKKDELQQLFTKLQKEIEDLQQMKASILGNAQVQQQQQNQNSNFQPDYITQQNHFQSSSKDDIIHITASNIKTPQNNTTEADNIQSQQQQQEQQNESQQENESLEFVPDPDFLKKINQNMMQNDINLVQTNTNENQEEVKGTNNDLIIQNNYDLYGEYQEDQLSQSQAEYDQQQFVSNDAYQKMFGNQHQLVEEEEQPFQHYNQQDINRVEYISDNFENDLEDYHENNTGNQNTAQKQNFDDQNNDQEEQYRVFELEQDDENKEFNTVKKDRDDQDLEDSEQKQKYRKDKLPEDEIIRLINEKYMEEEINKDVSVIIKDDKVYDQPKKAVYGIQKIEADF